MERIGELFIVSQIVRYRVESTCRKCKERKKEKEGKRKKNKTKERKIKSKKERYGGMEMRTRATGVVADWVQMSYRRYSVAA